MKISLPGASTLLHIPYDNINLAWQCSSSWREFVASSIQPQTARPCTNETRRMNVISDVGRGVAAKVSKGRNREKHNFWHVDKSKSATCIVGNVCCIERVLM